MQSQSFAYTKRIVVVLVILLFASLSARSPAVSQHAFDRTQGDGDTIAWYNTTAKQTGSVAHRPADALAALQARSPDPIAVHWDANVGIPDWLSVAAPGGRLPYTLSPAEHGNPTAIAQG